jgi:hypothetical protein
MVARCGKGGHLMSPRKGMLWPAVTEHNRFSYILSACFKDFEFHTVDWNKGRFGKISKINHYITSLKIVIGNVASWCDISMSGLK